ncbi:hypothetical protein BST17_07850 [Mycolicibacterium bacteremicum]|uniref:Uncharacterized protein n=1 Tax=Mycolicibacterium bacteremicum TaxID=564198 RepID=A0A1W9Z0H6_MYCBA|nr:hypothetical protein BST17_07850 [Mycolicibacterium bacteremicum]
MLGSVTAHGPFYPVLWLVFLPVRMWMKKNRPEEYAASQRTESRLWLFSRGHSHEVHGFR